MYCGEHTAVKWGENQRFAVVLPCNAWTCPDCQPQRAKRLRAEVLGGSPRLFLTLTSRRRDGITANEAARELSRCWRLVRYRLIRHYKVKSLPFFAVFEATKAGWPHLHIMLRSRFLDGALIAKWMGELSNSPVVKIERVRDRRRVGAYVAKYAGKAAHKFGTAKRYWQSPDYDLRSPPPATPPLRPGEGWEIERRPLHAILRDWRLFGWHVVVEGARRARAYTRGPPSEEEGQI